MVSRFGETSSSFKVTSSPSVWSWRDAHPYQRQLQVQDQRKSVKNTSSSFSFSSSTSSAPPSHYQHHRQHHHHYHHQFLCLHRLTGSPSCRRVFGQDSVAKCIKTRFSFTISKHSLSGNEKWLIALERATLRMRNRQNKLRARR